MRPFASDGERTRCSAWFVDGNAFASCQSARPRAPGLAWPRPGSKGLSLEREPGDRDGSRDLTTPYRDTEDRTTRLKVRMAVNDQLPQRGHRYQELYSRRIGMLRSAMRQPPVKKQMTEETIIDESDCGNGSGRGNGRDEAGGAARAAGSDKRRRRSGSCVGIRPGPSWRGLRPGPIASTATEHRRSPGTSWPEWSPPSATARLGLSVGQRVFGLADWCIATAPWRSMWPSRHATSRRCRAMSTSRSAQACRCSGLTAWQGLFEHGRLQAGQSVLVHGAAGASRVDGDAART